MLTRLTRDLRPFLRQPMELDRARAVVGERLRHRNERFLDLVRRGIYAVPHSPYRRLLRHAGCELGDVEQSVARDGVETTLASLMREGVYVTLEEFKGRRPAVRGSQTFAFSDADFDNPLAPAHFVIRSGGTRGPATRVGMSLSFSADLSANTLVALDSHGLAADDQVIWLLSGIFQLLRLAKLGRPPVAWFHPVRPLPVKVHAGALYLSVLGHICGSAIPRPRFLDLRQPETLAAWLAERAARGQRLCVMTYASSAARVAAAATAAGRRLDGVCFVVTGEPFTASKKQLVEASGARAVVHYGMTESGAIGFSCARAAVPDEVHFYQDCHALVTRPITVARGGPPLPAFLLTSLLPSTPKIFFNTENGDTGELEVRHCGCPLDDLGLPMHIREIRSFEKLVSEGMTFAHIDLLHVLEQVLPGRFGGRSTDYQAVEAEDEDGTSRLYLYVDPGVGHLDDERVRSAFLEELARDGGFARMEARYWQKARTVIVRRQPPIATAAGKILPFQLIAAAGGEKRASDSAA